MTLKEHLSLKGKTDSWLNLANQFGITGTNKQKSDKVRRLYQSISGDVKLHVVIGCVHAPFHNKVLIQSLCNFMQDHKDRIKGFHICGDFLDLKSLSTHDENVIDLSELTLGKEYQESEKVLSTLIKPLRKDVIKTYIFGNHENRYLNYVKNIKNYKTSDAIKSPTEGLDLIKKGFKVLENWKEDYITVGKYQLFHGQFCNQTPAKTHTLRGKSSCIFFHTHRVDQFFEKSLHGINGGSLADFSSSVFKYASRYEKELWQNAFVVISETELSSQAELIICNNNSFFYGGKKY